MCFLNTLILFVSTLGGASAGSDRQAEMKDLLDMEHLQLNEHASKASKAQVGCSPLSGWHVCEVSSPQTGLVFPADRVGLPLLHFHQQAVPAGLRDLYHRET